MRSYKKKLEDLEKNIAAADARMFTVYFKYGKARRLSPGDAALLSLNESEKVQCFKASPGGGSGILAGILNTVITL